MSGHNNTKPQPGPKRSQCRDVFLFSHPRTASNLLSRLLSDQPGWVQTEYHWQTTFMFAEKTFHHVPITEFTEEQRHEYGSMLQSGMESFDKAHQNAIENDTPLFIKNHVVQLFEPSHLSQSIWGGPLPPPFPIPSNTDSTNPTPHTNPTILSDAYLHSVQPIFIIRHPALAFESWYRTESSAGAVDINDKAWGFYMSYTYSRQLYDWYTSDENLKNCAASSSSVVIVVDADDIINQTSVSKLCDLCGMDPNLVRYQWDVTAPKDGQEVTQRHLSYMGGLWKSTTIDKSKSSEAVDLDEKHKAWTEQFGQPVADSLRKRVDDAMEDYTYLKSKRI